MSIAATAMRLNPDCDEREPCTSQLVGKAMIDVAMVGLIRTDGDDDFAQALVTGEFPVGDGDGWRRDVGEGTVVLATIAEVYPAARDSCVVLRSRTGYLACRQTSTALVPPNANEFDMTAPTSTPVRPVPGT